MLGPQNVDIVTETDGLQISHRECGWTTAVSFGALVEQGVVVCPRDGVHLTDHKQQVEALSGSIAALTLDPLLTPELRRASVAQVVACLDKLAAR